ncbi:MAG: threonylcarbamoyl-AMP synthase [Gammaproteobacteria bacterium]|nr:threonylcarbamoyl-AMP synthase [Gammaproteobacteria bacterium]
MSANTLILHPVNPQSRLAAQAARTVAAGGVIAYPTDSSYALGCRLSDKTAAARMRRLRDADRHHPFTLVCRDLSEIATYAHVDNPAYRLLRSLTPGPYTFVLPATREVPRRLVHPKRKAIGIRVPDNAVARALLAALDEPLMSTTVVDGTEPLGDALAVEEAYGGGVDLIVDGGPTPGEPTTVIELKDGGVRLLREGRGPVGDWAY